MKQLWSEEEISKVIAENSPKLYTHNINITIFSIEEAEWHLGIQVVNFKKEAYSSEEMATIFEKITQNDFGAFYRYSTLENSGDYYFPLFADETNVYWLQEAASNAKYYAFEYTSEGMKFEDFVIEN